MSNLHGFELICEENIQEINGTARIYRHVKTGAELLSITTEDENKCFGISFRTPPPNGTGLPHILEHSVLCGSRKYPVKEPFVELIKGSLHTYLNAFTYPDRTVYPVASQNERDFYNLVDVYLDAVFHPRITRHIFEQEGWHYEIDKPEEPLRYKGVVFNEMKGAYSSPDRLIYEYSQHSLFPDNAYGVDSGGDPVEIPDLLYDEFVEFHRTFYHPSNALICFYGDDDPEKRLAVLDEYLREFDPIEVTSKIPLQPRFTEPKRFVRTYEAGDETGPKRGMVTVNWILAETLEPELHYAFHALGHILIGTPASPLRKALIDSGLGEELTGAGLESEIRETFFSTGLKGIDPDDSQKVEDLVLSTLEGLARDGIDRKTVEASLNTLEFALRENNTGGFPRGLALMLRAHDLWTFDGDPLAVLSFEKPLAAIKEKFTSGEKYFEQLIQTYLLDNPHRTTVLLKPEPGLGEKLAVEEKNRLGRARSSMSPERIDELVADTAELKRLQAEPDPPEALATIPRLTLDDLDKEIKTIPIEITGQNGTEILYHDLFTNGIVYLDLGFNLHILPQESLPYLPLFGRALLEMGTEKEDYVSLLQRIGRTTGGISRGFLTSSLPEQSVGLAWFFLRGKAMVPQVDDLLGILGDVLTTARLDNRDRFRQMVLEEKAAFEAGLTLAGHRIVSGRLRSRFTEADWASEQMGGITYLFFLRRLAEEIESDWPKVLDNLVSIRNTLLNRNAMLCNVTLDGDGWNGVRPMIASFLADLPAADTATAQWSRESDMTPEGLTLPAQVNYVGKATNLYDLGYEYDGSSMVITRFISRTWLWDRVRVQGGAYGAFCNFDRRSGVLGFASYRDPNLLETIDVYDQAADFLRDIPISGDELTKAIIGAVSDLDAYQLPDAKGYTSMARHLAGDTDEDRQKRRDQVLSTTVDDFKRFADVLMRAKEKGLVGVLGAPAAIKEANEKLNGLFQVTKVL
jgi:Zn-dependent M16 (insulinase) family peptidase